MHSGFLNEHAFGHVSDFAGRDARGSIGAPGKSTGIPASEEGLALGACAFAGALVSANANANANATRTTSAPPPNPSALPIFLFNKRCGPNMRGFDTHFRRLLYA